MMKWEIVLFTILLLALFLLLWRYRRQEGRRLRQRVKEALSPPLREEIDRERAEVIEKKKKFDEAMKQASR